MGFRTRRAQNAIQALEDRLSNRLYRPGDRFATARQVADQYAVSYQTAHRILADLADRGLIVRRARSGSFIAGPKPRPTRVQLVLPPRADNPQGFGGKLRQSLLDALADANLPCEVATDASAITGPDALPIIWEMPQAVRRCVEMGRPGILVNQRPDPGWGSSLLDSVCADDYAGGALAADTLLQGVKHDARFAVLAGPRGDRRSDERIAGFRSRIKDLQTTHADNWHRDAGRRAASGLFDLKLTGVFAANDRLAQGLLLAYQAKGQQAPRVVGYDDAPIARQLGLTTIALPWRAIAQAVVERAQLRLRGDLTPARTLLLQPTIIFHDQ